MRYRHYLTFRYERTEALMESNGYASITGDSVDTFMTEPALRLAFDQVQNARAQALGCHPGTILLFIVNHTVTKL